MQCITPFFVPHFFAKIILNQIIPHQKTISILGCGWFGLPLAKHLIGKGYLVKGSTTTTEKIPNLKEAGIIPYLINLEDEITAQSLDFFSSDILLCCIPPKRDPLVLAKYPEKITKMMDAATIGKVKEIIFISSTSVFGDHNQIYTELHSPQPDSISGNILLEAEIYLRENTAIRSTIVRFSGLFGPGRDPGRFFAGKTSIPNGEAGVNLIELTDCIGIVTAILQQEKYGLTYHACSPDHPTRSSFYTIAAKKSGLELPEFKPEKKQWKIIESEIVNKILQYNFQVELNSLVNQSDRKS